MTSLTINNGKETEFEFDVSIQGTSANQTSVRFVIESVNGYDVTINCQPRKNDKWLAKIPSLNLTEQMQNFRVEVITDGYYFCPTSGQMQVVSNPRVSIAETFQKVSEAKPTVVTSGLIAPVQPKPLKEKQLVLIENMDTRQKSALFANCKAAGRVLTKAGTLMQSFMENQKQPVSSKTLISILEAVKHAVGTIEVKVYL